ncbi:MAG: o-succinylbenzoate synthase [Deltaproteobacteria bacterium]|nr:o-succinylbenzoate synthase [Deltaproteobacteria bacterium]
MSFQIEEVVVRIVRLPLIEPFRVSFGTVKDRDQIVVELRGGGISGWGESAVLPFPFYNHETPGTAQHILKDFAIPLFKKERPTSPQETNRVFEKIVGHRIARSGVEMAYWDWEAKAKGIPLYKHLGGTRSEVPVGISVPLFDDINVLLDRIAGFLEKGYHKIKIKIGPGEDLKLVEAIYTRFGEIPLMVDANSAYTLEHISLFKDLDRFKLMMIEQPLRHDDIFDHAKLQREIKNPICLDESIEHVHDAASAIELGSCKIINIKPGRVGGLTESKKIHDLAAQHGVGVWCGGMLETGIGRAANIAIATLPNYKYPGDIGESARYYHEDIVDPSIALSPRGTMVLPDKPGIGFDVNLERLKKYTRHEERFSMS